MRAAARRDGQRAQHIARLATLAARHRADGPAAGEPFAGAFPGGQALPPILRSVGFAALAAEADDPPPFLTRSAERGTLKYFQNVFSNPPMQLTQLKGMSHENSGGYCYMYINRKLFSRAIVAHIKILILLKGQFTINKRRSSI